MAGRGEEGVAVRHSGVAVRHSGVPVRHFGVVARHSGVVARHFGVAVRHFDAGKEFGSAEKGQFAAETERGDAKMGRCGTGKTRFDNLWKACPVEAGRCTTRLEVP